MMNVKISVYNGSEYHDSLVIADFRNKSVLEVSGEIQDFLISKAFEIEDEGDEDDCNNE